MLPCGDPEPARYSVVPDQDTPVEDLLPHGVGVVEAAELHEVGVGRGHLVADRQQLGHQPVALRLQLFDVLQQRAGVLQGGQRLAWMDGSGEEQ